METQKDKYTLSEWLNYLEQRFAVEINLGLNRIQQAAENMGLLTPTCKVITVAGTNGKGSTVAALEAIYHAAGYRIGAYTSPHLLQFNERIRLNKQPITDEYLCLAFAEIDKYCPNNELSYFEVVTLAALWYYKEQNLDVMVLEVGLGGRLDATNIINSDLAIITTIDYDHQAYLGNTLEAIGFEKAGIMRKGKPCIYADYLPPLSIIEQANEKQTPLFCLGKNYNLIENNNDFIVESMHGCIQLPKPKIQLKAASAAIMATQLLHDYLPVSSDNQIQAMESVYIPGRLELIKGEIDILYDVSHNAQAAIVLREFVKKYHCSGKIHVVFSALADKDLNGIITPMRDCVAGWYPAQLNTKRAATRELLTQTFNRLAIIPQAYYVNPQAAFLAAKSQASAGDLIIVYGSFYTVEAVYRFNMEK